MAKTHKEKDEEIKLLKDEIRKLRSEAKSVEADIEGLDESAHGIIIKDGCFNLVSLKFDLESNKAAIDQVKDLGKSLVNASSVVKHAVIDRLVEINKGRR